VKRLLLLLALPLCAQPTVTSVSVSAIGHSVARISATSSLSIYGVNPSGERIRWGTTTAYEASPGGGILSQGMQQCDHVAVQCPGVYQIYATLSGLAPSTLYHVQMQASTDGVTWGSSADSTFTTLALPGTHPALPTAPETFDTTYPDTSAYTTVTATNCSDLNTKLATAVNARGSGWVILLAPGLFDTTSGVCMQPPVDPSAMAFTPSNVVAGGTNTITVTGTVTANEPFRFATDFESGACLPGYGPTCFTSGPLVYGVVYYAINPVPSGGNTTFQVSYTSGGSPISLLNTGTGTSYLVPIPAPGGPEIIIRTATADSAFCPAGVKCLGSIWAPLMSTLQVTGGLWTSSGDPEFGPLVYESYIGAHDIRLMGLEMTQSDASSLANTSTDPRPTYSILDSEYQVATTRLIIDRSYLHGLPAPNRVYRGVTDFDGKYMAMVDSDFEFSYYRPWMDSGPGNGPTAFTQTISGMQVSTANGSTYYAGPAVGTAGACTSSGLSVTFTGGTVTGTAIEYFALSPTCTPTYVIPTGETATCAGTGSDGANTRACSVLTAASPAFPVDSNGSQWGGSAPITTISLTAGAPASVATFGPAPSLWYTEGAQSLIAGWGPGPWQMYNNHVDAPGLAWHFDEGGAGVVNPLGYVLQRNEFLLSAKYHTGAAGSDNFDYEERNPVEWKNGSRCLVDGNTWTNFFAGVSSLGASLTYTPRALGTETDCEIRYNTSKNGAYFILAIGGFATGGQVAPNPLLRFYIHDNVVNQSNGWTQFSPANRYDAGCYPFSLGYAEEDLIIDHNTLYNPQCYDPSFIHMDVQGMEGFKLTNNVLWHSNDNGSYGLSSEGISGNTPNCGGGLIAYAYASLCYTQGIGTPFFLTGGNVDVPYYATTNPPSGITSASTMGTEWNCTFSGTVTCPGFLGGSNSGVNALIGDSTTAGRLADVDFTNPGSGIFSLASGSAWKGYATDSTDPGVAWSTLQNAQGVVQSVSITGLASTSATALATTPDTQGCPVDVYTSNPLVFTRFAQAGGSTSQSTALSGLSPSTTYTARWDCAVQQPTASFTTSAGSVGGPVSSGGVGNGDVN
jgi:hypothetical protein